MAEFADGTISATIQLSNKAMNENINIAEILKDAPKGTELWSPIVGEITFDRIRQDYKWSESYIIVKGHHENFYTFMSTGELFATDNYHGAIPISRGGMCVLFPSRDCLSWRDFKAPWMHKHFEHGQKVLVPYYDGTIYKWRLTFYSHYDDGTKQHITTDNMFLLDANVISYEGNEDKLGKPVE